VNTCFPFFFSNKFLREDLLSRLVQLFPFPRGNPSHYLRGPNFSWETFWAVKPPRRPPVGFRALMLPPPSRISEDFLATRSILFFLALRPESCPPLFFKENPPNGIYRGSPPRFVGDPPRAPYIRATVFPPQSFCLPLR